MACDHLWHKVRKYLKSLNVFHVPKRIVVAVSGGPDSVALLHLLKTYSHKNLPILSIQVAHLNHSFRGDDSDRDAEFVRSISEEWGLNYSVEKIDVDTIAKEQKKNFEATARKLRYEFLFRIAESIQADLIATGHTMSDQAETVLLRLLRGTSIDGLSGIRAVRTQCNSNVKIIRPLLKITRREVEDYLERNNLASCQDSTNNDMSFLRNRVRHQIIPLLEGLNPQIGKTLMQISSQAFMDSDYFALEVARWLSLNICLINNKIALPVKKLRELHPALLGRVLHNVTQIDHFPMVTNYHIEQIEKALIWNQKGGKVVVLPGQRQIRREKGFLFFNYSSEDISSDHWEYC